jgi:hypothetical protein
MKSASQQKKMSLNVIKKVIDLGDGRTIEIETGKLAKQADGSVVIKMGDTMLLATVVSSPEAKEGLIFYRFLLTTRKNTLLPVVSRWFFTPRGTFIRL